MNGHQKEGNRLKDQERDGGSMLMVHALKKRGLTLGQVEEEQTYLDRAEWRRLVRLGS